MLRLDVGYTLILELQFVQPREKDTVKGLGQWTYFPIGCKHGSACTKFSSTYYPYLYKIMVQSRITWLIHLLKNQLATVNFCFCSLVVESRMHYKVKLSACHPKKMFEEYLTFLYVLYKHFFIYNAFGESWFQKKGTSFFLLLPLLVCSFQYQEK